MKIILSPTKTMRQENCCTPHETLPAFLQKSQELLNTLKTLSLQELRSIWKCSDALAQQNSERFASLNLYDHLTPAIFSYEGLAFQYMRAEDFDAQQLSYLQNHLRILSGLYGVLKPLDGIQAYRLDMQDKIFLPGYKNLYDFWGKSLYDAVHDSDGLILNLASKEYAKCIERYLSPADTFITCIFIENVNGKMVQKATFSKMARGAMVRYIAERQISNPAQLTDFNDLGFHFRPDLSTRTEYVYERNP